MQKVYEQEKYAKKYEMPRVYLRFVGLWDMQDLYECMADFFTKRKYHLHEKVYKHKTPSPFGVERQYMWEAENPYSEWIMFTIAIYMHTYDAHEIDVKMPDGTTKKMTQGRIRIEFDGNIKYDWEKRWEKSLFYSRLHNFYSKYVIKRFMESLWWDTLWYREIMKLHSMIKEKLQMYSKGYEHRYWTGVHA